MSGPAAELARRLARDAEAVCRHYLSRGRRHGRYWIVGDVLNTPGRSLYVRLRGPESGRGAAGKWTDASTLEHGDLLDLIALNRGLDRLPDVLDEARSFLSLPRPAPPPDNGGSAVLTGSPDAARRLFRIGKPIMGTLAEAYLRGRFITAPLDWSCLRYHPSVYYRAHEDAPLETWPALLTAATDLRGRVTGVHRTWLDPARIDKAPLVDPRRSLGELLGSGARFGPVTANVQAAGEGLETVLSLKSVLPPMSMVAGLSANHLAALDLPRTLRRLYVVRDNDAAGRAAAERLHDRGAVSGIEVRDLVPVFDDFNVDLCRLGTALLLRHVAVQLAPEDRLRFVPHLRDREMCGGA
jgi:hypothetical protein